MRVSDYETIEGGLSSQEGPCDDGGNAGNGMMGLHDSRSRLQMITYWSIDIMMSGIGQNKTIEK